MPAVFKALLIISPIIGLTVVAPIYSAIVKDSKSAFLHRLAWPLGILLVSLGLLTVVIFFVVYAIGAFLSLRDDKPHFNDTHE